MEDSTTPVLHLAPQLAEAAQPTSTRRFSAKAERDPYHVYVGGGSAVEGLIVGGPVVGGSPSSEGRASMTMTMMMTTHRSTRLNKDVLHTLYAAWLGWGVHHNLFILFIMDTFTAHFTHMRVSKALLQITECHRLDLVGLFEQPCLGLGFELFQCQ